MIKIFDGEKVYIPTNEIPDMLHWTAIGLISSENFSEVPHYGPCIEESVYNRLLAECAEKEGSELEEDLEFTKVISLSAQIDNVKAIRPLKTLFLSTFLSKEEIKQSLDAEDAAEKEKLLKVLTDGKSCNMSSYQTAVAYLINNSRTLHSVLTEAGLVLQHITEIKDDTVGLISYLAGKDVFCQVYLTDWDEELASYIKLDDDTLMIPSPYSEEGVEFVSLTNTGRDFSKYTARENLFWCVTNLDVTNDFTDEITCSNGGVDFSMSLEMLVKLFNDKAFSNHIFADGMIDVAERIIPAGRSD